MSGPPESGAFGRRIALGQQPPFELGRLAVRPALRTVVAPGGEEILLQPRVMQVLIALAEANGGIVTRDELLERCWNGVVVSEDAIHRAIAQLRRLCRQVGDGALQVATVTKVGYRLVASSVADPSRPVEPPRPTGEGPVLAVLPFDNLSGADDFAYFADGISEEILSTVARGTGLRIVGRSSSFQFRGVDKSARRIRAELGATHVLDGAVRRAGDQVRITAELVDCASLTCLWSESFDQPLTNVFALQERIAAQVARTLNVWFDTAAARVDPIDQHLFDDYLRARSLTAKGSFDTAILEQVTARAPGFSPAWSLLAVAYAIRFRWATSVERRAELRARVQEAADRALALDPSAAHAHLALDLIEPICGRTEARLAHLERALAAAPHDGLVLIQAAGVQETLGHLRQSDSLFLSAYRLDPYHASFYRPHALARAGRLAEARVALRQEAERWPDHGIARAAHLRVACEIGDWEFYDAAVERMAPALASVPAVRDLQAIARQVRAAGPDARATALAKLRRELELSGTVSLTRCAFAAAHGSTDEIHDLLSQASFTHLFEPDGQFPSPDVSLNVLFSPLFAPLRRDRRFVGLCAKLGLVDHWVRSRQWPDCVAEVARFYDLPAIATALAGAAAPRSDLASAAGMANSRRAP